MLIQYTQGRCCCGKCKFIKKDFIHNDIVHQPLGPEGNFCGPVHQHTIRFLESKVERLEAELKTLKQIIEEYNWI